MSVLQDEKNHVECPECEASVDIQDILEGEQIVCPKCLNEFTKSAAISHAAAKERKKRNSSLQLSPIAILAIAIAFVFLIVIVLGALAFFLAK